MKPRRYLDRLLVGSEQHGLPFVSDSAFLDATKPFPLGFHAHPGYEICYLLSGAVHWGLEDGTAMHLSGGMFSLIQPGIQHEGLFKQIDPCEMVWLVFHPDRADRTGNGLGFDRSMLDQMRSTFSQAGNVVVKGSERMKAAARCFADTLDPMRTGGWSPHLRPWVQSSMVQIIWSIQETLTDPVMVRTETDGLVEHCDRMLRQRLGERVTVDDMARLVRLRPSAFFNRFKQAAGMTPAEYLRRLRIQAAQRRLASSNEPVTAIALACGFASSQHFSTSFKDFTGLTPRQFRLRFAG